MVGVLAKFCKPNCPRFSRVRYSAKKGRKYAIDTCYSRVAYIYVRSCAKYLKFRTTTSKFNTLRKPLMQQKYYFIHEM